MITVFDTRQNLKDGLQSIPLDEIDWRLDLLVWPRTSDVLHTVQMSNLVIIVDYDSQQYRVVKDQHTGETWTGHTNELGQFLSDWVTQEQSFVTTSLSEYEDADGNG